MNERFSPPSPEYERHLSDGLDFYKLTMGQLAVERFPEASVTFTLKNRGGEFPLSEFVDPATLQERLQAIRDKGFSAEEIAAIAGMEAQDGSSRFDAPYLDFLADLTLTDVSVSTHPETGDLALESTGSWSNVSLWETVVMSELNELYFESLLQQRGIDTAEVWAEGDRRLDEKIERLKGSDIAFADFGTRRRFSAEWQDHVVGRLAKELPDNLIGTSNPWFAHKHGIPPIGTYAHEMPMVYAAIADKNGEDPLEGHTAMMQDWHGRYGEDLSIALTDTFTSDFFFSDFTPEQAEAWRGVRHDSGDPIDFGEQTIAFYESNGIDPKQKTIVFSDGLDIDTIFALDAHFKGRTKVVFGWGTSLTNDLGLRANNFVMKATAVDGTPTVKLSDVEGKHTGPDEQVARYASLVQVRSDVALAYESTTV